MNSLSPSFFSLREGQLPHASFSSSSPSQGVFRACHKPQQSIGLKAGFAIPAANPKKCRPLKTRWRAEAGKDVADPERASPGLAEGGDASTAEANSASRMASGMGFGAAPASSSLKASKEKGSKEKKKSTTIRRTPPPKPVITPQGDPQAQQLETAFIVSWAFLGALILLEGLTLAASGFLPEEWDEVLVKFLYPSFTPTVGLFLAGAVVYGLYKYFGGGAKPS